MAVTPTLAPEQGHTDTAPQAPAPALPDPDWNWWHLPQRGDTDPDTARQARALRIRWRLEHPAAWRAEIESLSHYQPEYPYDEGYEYDEDFTTDPHYGSDAALLDYDAEGFVTAEAPLHGFGLTMGQLDLEQHLQTLGWALHKEPHVYFPTTVGRRLGLRTPSDKDQQVVKPDLVVVPADSPSFDSGNLWLGRGDPAPLLILEFLSPTSTRRDREEKRRLYAHFGVREYAVCDLGADPHRLESVRPPWNCTACGRTAPTCACQLTSMRRHPCRARRPPARFWACSCACTRRHPARGPASSGATPCRTAGAITMRTTSTACAKPASKAMRRAMRRAMPRVAPKAMWRAAPRSAWPWPCG